MIYGALRNIGADFEYFTGDGMVYVIIPLPVLCTGENILTLKKKNGWF